MKEFDELRTIYDEVTDAVDTLHEDVQALHLVAECGESDDDYWLAGGYDPLSEVGIDVPTLEYCGNDGRDLPEHQTRGFQTWDEMADWLFQRRTEGKIKRVYVESA